MTGTTDSKGRNYAVWTLGLGEGTQVARVVSGLTGVPVEFEAEATALHAVQVAAGGSYACAILSDQRPVCWGSNRDGQLGTGDSLSHFAETPVPVAGLSAALEIRASNGGLTCARDLAGDAWCWGRNDFGQAGPAASIPIQPTPVRISGAEGASSLAIESDYLGHACVLLGVGGARCWGANWSGQLGTGNRASSAAPMPVLGSERFIQIAVGDDRTCALDADGESWCWGYGYGNGFAPLPSDLYLVPTRPLPGYRYLSLAVGKNSVCGIQLGGEVTCFGDDWDGGLGTQLGYPNWTTVPVRPDVQENFGALSSDGYGSFFGTTRYGDGFMWGGEYHSGVTVPPKVVTPSFRVIDMSASPNQYCVVSESGGVYCGRRNGEYGWRGEERLVGVPAIITP